MTVEKKIIGWEIVMSVLFVLLICSGIGIIFSLHYDFKTDLGIAVFITSIMIPFVLFLAIYFIMPQPFRDLLLKAKDILSKKDFIYFGFDLSKSKISTNLLNISSKADKGINDHLHESQLELNPDELELLKSEIKKKTKYAKFVIFLNIGVWSAYLIGFFSSQFKIEFLSDILYVFIGLVLVFLYLRYTYNTFILLLFNKKLSQIEETPSISYHNIRDLY